MIEMICFIGGMIIIWVLLIEIFRDTTKETGESNDKDNQHKR